MLVMRVPIRLAWNWGMKKRVPKSMPTSEALGKPVLNTWENAPFGRALLVVQYKAIKASQKIRLLKIS